MSSFVFGFIVIGLSKILLLLYGKYAFRDSKDPVNIPEKPKDKWADEVKKLENEKPFSAEAWWE